MVGKGGQQEGRVGGGMPGYPGKGSLGTRGCLGAGSRPLLSLARRTVRVALPPVR